MKLLNGFSQTSLSALLVTAVFACGSDGTNAPTQPGPTSDAGPQVADAATLADGGTTIDSGAPGTTGYPVPQGCDMPPTGGGNMFYVDPSSGSMSNDGSAAHPWSTLAEVIAANKIETNEYPRPYKAGAATTKKNVGAPVKAGDTILLRTGDHGTVNISGYVNDAFITIKAETGQTPRIQRLSVTGSSRLILEGLTVQPTTMPGDPLISVINHNFIGPSSNIILARNTVQTTQDSSAFTASDWLMAPNGIEASGTCSTVVGNKVRNIRFGIVIGGDSVMDSNLVESFSGDGLRLFNNHSTARHNVIQNSTLSDADGDGNHDDGIQSFNLDPGSFDDMTLDGNIIIESTDPKRKFQADMQGIGIFDGIYTRLKVINNVVSVSAYHGIGILGANDSLIANNTVVGDPRSWIALTDAKDGRKPVNSIVRNNLGYKISGDTLDHNVILTDPSKHFVKFDRTTGSFDFHLLPASTAKGAGTPMLAPSVDIEGKVRANPPSAGAYE